jgi:glycosyltransferase involved in cell wall biosynthesis
VATGVALADARGSANGRNGAVDNGTAGVGAVPGLRVIQHPFNQGKGAAIRTALVASTGDYCIIQDADFEYDPADIPRLLQPITDGQAKVVYGARPLDGSGGRWLLDFGNRALSVITNLLYGTRLHDMETCYKVLPTALLRSFNLECSRFDMEPEITAKVTRSGYRIVEVPISYHPRAGGKKLSARKDGLPALQALLRYRTWQPPAR